MLELKCIFSDKEIEKMYGGNIKLENGVSFIAKSPIDLIIPPNDLINLGLKFSIDMSSYGNKFIIEGFTVKTLLENKCVVVPCIFDSSSNSEWSISLHNFSNKPYTLKKESDVIKFFVLDNTKVLTVF